MKLVFAKLLITRTGYFWWCAVQNSYKSLSLKKGKAGLGSPALDADVLRLKCCVTGQIHGHGEVGSVPKVYLSVMDQRRIRSTAGEYNYQCMNWS